MSDRDVSILLLAILVAVIVGVVETFITFAPQQTDGIFDAALTFGVAWGFYRLRS